MNISFLIRIITMLLVNLSALSSAFSQIRLAVTYTNYQQSLYPETVLRELDLIRPLFADTNMIFDAEVCKSVKALSKEPAVVTYQLVSFVFHYPTTNGSGGSTTELWSTDELICAKEGISRRATTNQIPANYVRVLDTQRKQVSCDLDLLLGVAPLQGPQEVKCFRRTFRFTYQNGWRED
jgi:hypothetical protein